MPLLLLFLFFTNIALAECLKNCATQHGMCTGSTLEGATSLTTLQLLKVLPLNSVGELKRALQKEGPDRVHFGDVNDWKILRDGKKGEITVQPIKKDGDSLQKIILKEPTPGECSDDYRKCLNKCESDKGGA